MLRFAAVAANFGGHEPVPRRRNIYRSTWTVPRIRTVFGRVWTYVQIRLRAGGGHGKRLIVETNLPRAIRRPGLRTASCLRRPLRPSCASSHAPKPPTLRRSARPAASLGYAGEDIRQPVPHPAGLVSRRLKTFTSAASASSDREMEQRSTAKRLNLKLVLRPSSSSRLTRCRGRSLWSRATEGRCDDDDGA